MFLPGAMRASRPTHELWGYRKFYLYNMARGSGGVSDPALQKFRTLSTYSNPNIPARHHAPHSPNMIFSSFPKTGHAANPAACPALSQIPNYSFLRQYRIILSADTASEVRQMLSQKRR